MPREAQADLGKFLSLEPKAFSVFLLNEIGSQIFDWRYQVKTGCDSNQKE